MSERTLHRRAREWDLLKYSIITDIELDTIVMKQLEDLPCAGEAMLMQKLFAYPPSTTPKV